VTPEQARADAATTAELIDHLIRFQGPPGEFLVNLLAVQCRLAGAAGGAILRHASEGRTQVLAIYPPLAEGSPAPVWLAQAVEAVPGVSSSGSTAVRPVHGPDDLYGQPAKRNLVMIPMGRAQGVRGLAAFILQTSDQQALSASREKLEMTASLLSLYEMQVTLQRREADIRRLRMSTEVLASINQQERFGSASMSFCNEVATKWRCDRVSLGFLKGRYVHLKAMSHTEKFSRKMKIVQDIESAMEECLDQDVETAHPGAEGANYVSRAAAELSHRHGPTAVLSLPLRKAGEPIGVLTVERPADSPLSVPEVEALRLGCDLCTARLSNLHEHDRWFGARAAAGTRKALAAVVGPRHTWAKLVAMCVFAAVMFLVFAKGQYRVGASFELKTADRQVIAAPFKGYVASVEVEPGDEVIAGETVLARMDTSKIEDLLARATADYNRSDLKAAAAERDGKPDEARVAREEAAISAAEKSIQERLKKKAVLKSRISGHVVVHKLEHRVGSAVEPREVLFEVAPLDRFRADLFVPEDQRADVRKGQQGEIADPSSPDRRARFVVERINPEAEVVKGENVFRARVQLLEIKPWMKHGLEGQAKISIDRRRYAWIWTRRLVNWVRMKLWL
jgi:biotin carboxyl carrier protein